jgi:hypothetical protein
MSTTGSAMSELSTQVKLRRVERQQIVDRRVAIAALSIAIVVGGLAIWNARVQAALSRAAETRQAWSELLLHSDDEQMWKARRTLRAYIEQAKRMPGALSERNGIDGFVIKTTTRCFSLYVYATLVLPTGATDDCLPKTTKSEDKEKYYSDIDASRRLVKAFHEKLMLLDKQDLTTAPVRQRFMSDSTVDFLTTIWLPVEKGLNHTVEKDADAKDKNAQAIRDWYAERVKKLKEGPQGPDLVPETSYY